MLRMIRELFMTGPKSRRLKKDRFGKTIANRQGCDEKPNEPYDCIAPPLRIETNEQKRAIQDHLKRSG